MKQKPNNGPMSDACAKSAEPLTSPTHDSTRPPVLSLSSLPSLPATRRLSRRVKNFISETPTGVHQRTFDKFGNGQTPAINQNISHKRLVQLSANSYNESGKENTETIKTTNSLPKLHNRQNYKKPEQVRPPKKKKKKKDVGR